MSRPNSVSQSRATATPPLVPPKPAAYRSSTRQPLASSSSKDTRTATRASAPEHVSPTPPRAGDDPERNVYEVSWSDGQRRPGIAKIYTEILFGPEVGGMPLNLRDKRFYPKPIGVNEIIEKLCGKGLAVRTRRFMDIKNDAQNRGGRNEVHECTKLGGFIWLPQKTEHGNDGQPAKKSESDERKNRPNEFWYVSTKEDRDFSVKYFEEYNRKLLENKSGLA